MVNSLRLEPVIEKSLEIEAPRWRISPLPNFPLYRRIVGSPSGLRSRLLSGVLWTMVMSCIVQGSALMASIITARLLGYIEFGKYAMIYSLIVMMAGFAGIGLGPTTTKYISELRTSAPDRAGRILGLCFIMTIITGIICSAGLFIIAPWVARDLLKAGELAIQLRLGAIYILLFALNSYQIGALSGFEAFSRIARVSTLQGPVIVVLTAALTWSLGLNGAVLAIVIVMFSSWFFHQRALHAECRRYNIRISYTKLHQELYAILHIALPAAASGYLGGLAVVGINAMLVRQPGGFAQMAIFNAANSIRTLVLLVPGMVTRVATPLLCNLHASQDVRRYKRTFWTCLIINLGLSTSVALLLYLGAYPLLRLFGKEFLQGQVTLGVLMFAAVIETLAVALYQPLYSHSHLWLHFGILSSWSGLLMTGTWFWVAKGGATALAASYLVAWMFSVVLYALATRRILGKQTCSNLGMPMNTI